MRPFSVAAEQHIEKSLSALRLNSLDEAPPAIREQIEQRANEIALTDVFGHNFKLDRNGNPVEQGIGAKGNESEQHFAAILKYEGAEAERIAREKAARPKADKP